MDEEDELPDLRPATDEEDASTDEEELPKSLPAKRRRVCSLPAAPPNTTTWDEM